MSLEYFKKLEDLILAGYGVDKFKALYLEYFHKEPTEALIAQFIKNTNQVMAYENEQYDESSYEEDYNSY